MQHPRVDVAFAATTPFVKAYPKEAFAQNARFVQPTWSARISDAPPPVILKPPPEPVATMEALQQPAFIPEPIQATQQPEFLPPPPRFQAQAPSRNPLLSSRELSEMPPPQIDLVVGVIAIACVVGAGYVLYRWWGAEAAEVILPPLPE
jgi:hypothetical protein